VKASIYGNFTIGNKIIVEHLKNKVEICDYFGANVDLSKIIPDEENLIVISNPTLFQIDLDKVLGYINKDITLPLMVLKKVHTFGTVFFEPNFKIEKITTNKCYNFSGMLYLPKKYLENLPEDKKTMSEIFRSVPYDDWRFFIIDGRRQ
jgi:hypothetical protein